jgi:hypothetical protein
MASLFFLVKLHQTKTASFYAAYEHTVDGLAIVWPTNSSDHKAAKALGFHYALPSSAVPVAYCIKVEGYSSMAELNAREALATILKNMGRDIEGLDARALKGSFAWPIS